MRRLSQKVLNFYFNISAPVKAAVWFTICNVVQKSISFLTTPIFTRLLTTEQYGEYTTYSSWYQIISIFATLNLYYGVYNNGMTKFYDDRKRFTASMQGLCTIITCCVFALYILFHDFWNDVMGMSTLYTCTMFIELMFIPAYYFWSSSERYDYKYKTLIIVSLLIAVGSPILSIIAVVNTEYKAEARILSLASVQIIIGVWFYIYNFVQGKQLINKRYWKYALKFNLPLIPHYLSSVILGQSDRIMISNILGKSEAALYAVAYNVALVMNIVINAINNSFTPYMYKCMKSQNYYGIRNSSKFLVIFIGIISLISITLGPEIISVIAAPAYRDAKWAIPPIAASVFFMFLYPLFSNIEFYFDKTLYIMIASCLGAILNLVLNHLLILPYGYYAAGYTTLLCYIVYSFAHYFCASYLCRKNQISRKIFDIKLIFVMSLTVIIAMFLLLLLYPYPIIRIPIGITEICVATYLGFKWVKNSAAKAE